MIQEIDKTQDYWFIIKQYVHIAFQDNNIMLLYNTTNGCSIVSKDLVSINLIRSAQERRNLGVCHLSPDALKSRSLELFVIEAVSLQIAEIISKDKVRTKPISLMPILNVQADVEKLSLDKSRFIGENIMQYLTKLNLYINSQCSQKCKFCTSFYKQFSCCTKTNIENEISISTLEEILNQVKISPIGQINILGGNILNYSNLEYLIKIFEESKFRAIFWLYYKNIADGSNTELIGRLKRLNILISYPIDYRRLDNVLDHVSLSDTTFYVIAENDYQYGQAIKLQEKHINCTFKIFPFYNKENIEFLENNVYLNKEDILSQKVSQREIFCNQVLNTNHFGSLYILPDGTAKANLISDSLGNIDNKSISELLTIEIEQNTAWRRFRNKKPCNNCLYQFLCPPPSNYEAIIGKPNLCYLES